MDGKYVKKGAWKEGIVESIVLLCVCVHVSWCVFFFFLIISEGEKKGNKYNTIDYKQN